MIELLLVLGGVGVLIAGAVLVACVSPDAVLLGGAAIVVGGIALGVPTGLVYHILLGRYLSQRGPAPARWWWRPLEHHGALHARELSRVMPWCYAGATGFLFILIGCGVVTIGAFMVST